MKKQLIDALTKLLEDNGYELAAVKEDNPSTILDSAIRYNYDIHIDARKANKEEKKDADKND